MTTVQRTGTTTTTSASTSARGHGPRLRGWAGILLAGLLLQVVLGAANVAFLSKSAGADGENLSPAWLLATHAYVGLALAVIAVVLLVLAVRSRDGSWIVVATVAALGILLALVSGHLFVTRDDERASLLMAVGCVLALAACVVGVSRRGRPTS